MSIFQRRGIAFKLFIFFSLSSALVLMTIMSANYFYSRDKIEKQIKDHAVSTVKSSVNKVESVLNAVEKIPEILGHVIESKDYSAEEIEELLCSMLRLNPEVFGIAVAFEPYQFKKDRHYLGLYCHRKQREVVKKPFGSDSDRYFFQDWYQLPRELQSPQWSEPYYEENTLMSTYSVPIYRTQAGVRRLVGIMAADVSLEWLTDIMLSVKVLKSGYGVLISQNGTIVTHPVKRLIMNETFFSIAEENRDSRLREIGREMLKNESGLVEHSNLFGMNAYAYYTKIPSNDWRLLLLFPVDEILQDIRELNRNVAFLGVAGIMMLAFASVYIARTITEPLRRLSLSAEEIGKGNFDVEIPAVASNDEVGMLAGSLSSMRAELKDYMARLSETIAAKQRIESELSIAHEIQMSMLQKIFPPFPDRKEFDIFALLEPAREVGGDFYDFFLLDEDKVLFLVADVSGKGVPASLFMSMTMTLFKAKSSSHMTPDMILSTVNNDLCVGNDSSMFVTVFCGILSISTGELRYANGGHIPPVLISKKGDVSFIDMPDGLVLGVIKDTQFAAYSITLQPGDKLMCYTDGVTEAMNSRHELYGSERLLMKSAMFREKSIKDIAGSIMEEIVFFSESTPQSDDITLICLEYTGRG